MFRLNQIKGNRKQIKDNLFIHLPGWLINTKKFDGVHCGWTCKFKKKKICEGEFDSIYQNDKDTSPCPKSFVPRYLLYSYKSMSEMTYTQGYPLSHL